MSTGLSSRELSCATPSPHEILREPESASTGDSLVLRLLSRLRRMRMFAAAFLRLFRTFQSGGISVVPNHFYWPIPDIRTLEKREWPTRNCAFDVNLENQAEFAQRVVTSYARELGFQPENSNPAIYHLNNGLFESVDAEVAYCMVRDRKPRRIVEVGGGFSTRVMAAAVRTNAVEGTACKLTTIEPNPDGTLRHGFEGLSELISTKVQNVPIETFTSLEPGDILFIDSSHVVTVGGDVVYEFFEIFPRLQPGVIIHLHDIFYPSDYPRDAVLNFLWFWSEQYLLEALLTSNSGFEVLWASSAMQLLRPNVLEENFPNWDDSYQRMPPRIRKFIPTADGKRVWPSSFWMQKVSNRKETLS
jgi:predicted O-methyltransferase YrrM